MISDKKLHKQMNEYDEKILMEFYELTNIMQYPPTLRTTMMFEIEDFFNFLKLREYSCNTDKELDEGKCPKCGYDGLGVYNNKAGFQQHAYQLNPNNPFLWICGNCSEAFQRKNVKEKGEADE